MYSLLCAIWRIEKAQRHLLTKAGTIFNVTLIQTSGAIMFDVAIFTLVSGLLTFKIWVYDF